MPSGLKIGKLYWFCRLSGEDIGSITPISPNMHTRHQATACTLSSLNAIQPNVPHLYHWFRVIVFKLLPSRTVILLTVTALLCCTFMRASADGTVLDRRLPATGLEMTRPVAKQADFWMFDEEASVRADAKNKLTKGPQDQDADSQDSEIRKRLDELEARYSDLSDAHDDLADSYSDLKKSLKGYARSGHDKATMKIVGRIHADMWNFPGDSPGVNEIESGDPNISPQDRLGFRRIRFGVRGDLPYKIVYRIEMEFAGGNDSEFRDVFLGWKELPILQKLLIGNQKRPYGLDHINSSRYNVFIERPFVIEGFNQDARRFGIQSLGVSEDLTWNWRYGVFNQRLIQDEGNYVSDHFQAQFAGRMANTLWYDECSGGRGYAHWALSGTWADTDPNALADNLAESGRSEAQFRTRPEARSDQRWLDTGVIAGGDDYALLGLESAINVGALQFVSEYQSVWLNRAESDLNFHGAYAYVSYFLTGEHVPWDRTNGRIGRVKPFENFFLTSCCCGGTCCGLGAWQLALRYSYADFSDENIFGGTGKSLTAGLNWYWTPYARMQLNYIHGEIRDADIDSVPSDTNLVSGDYDIIGTRFLVDF